MRDSYQLYKGSNGVKPRWPLVYLGWLLLPLFSYLAKFLFSGSVILLTIVSYQTFYYWFRVRKLDEEAEFSLLLRVNKSLLI